MKNLVSIRLLQDVAHLGKAGDLTKASQSHVLHVLQPKKLAAIVPFKRSILTYEQKQEKLQRERDTLWGKKEEEEKLTSIKELLFQRKRKSLTGDIFGSVSAKDVLQALKAKSIFVDRGVIQMQKCKTFGIHQCVVDAEGTQLKIQINVSEEK